MKKLLLSAYVLLVVSNSSFSQLDRHTFMVGGSFSIDNYRYDGVEPSTRINLDVLSGYFLIDNLALGVAYSLDKYESNYTGHFLKPFARYYYKNIFLQASYGISTNTVSSSNGSYLGFDFGYAVFLNDNVALEPAFYFNQHFSDGNTGGQNLGFKMGLQIYLNR